MWRPIKIKIENVLSHVDTEYIFNLGVCTVIYGQNLTDSGSSSNGSGKSTIFEAISLALFGKTLRGVNRDSFINRDAEDCRVEFHLQNETLKSTLVIERRFFRNKSSKVRIIENDELNTQLTSVNEADKRILELIGISQDDLLRYYIIDTNQNSFFTDSDTEKKATLNRITSADMIIPKIEELKIKSRNLKQEIRELENESTRLNSRIDTYQEQLQELLNVDVDEEEIGKLNKSISNLKKAQQESQHVIIDGKERIELLDEKLSKLEIPDVDSLNLKLTKAKKNRRKIEEELDDAKSLLRTMEDELNHSITCPNCNHEFVRESNIDMSVDEIRSSIPSVKDEISSIQEKYDKSIQEIKRINDKISETDVVIESINKLKRQKKRIQNEIEEEEDSIKSKSKSILRIQKDIETLKAQKVDTAAVKTIKEKISECQVSLSKVVSQSKEKNEELEMVDYWIYYLGKSGFTTYLANKSIAVLAGLTNSFLRRLKTDLTVDISGFKVLADGTVRDKIEVFALTRGMNAELLTGKSSGEQTRIKLAGILAIQHLLNMSLDGRGLDLLILDESLGAIDSAAIEHLIPILENLGVTILIVSHNISEDYNSNYKVRVIKEKDISRIIS